MASVGVLVGAIILIIVGLALLPTVMNSAVTTAGSSLENLSSSGKAIVNLLPLFYVIGIMAGAFMWVRFGKS